MAYGITNTGFKAKRYEDIYNDIKERFKTNLNIDIDRYPDTIEKLITNIITLPIAQSWSNTQSLQTMFDIDKAEGVWLDNLASFFGITRSIGSYSRGTQLVTATAPIIISSEQSFSNQSGDIFLLDTAFDISENSLISVTYSFDNSITDGDMVLILNGSSYSSTVTVGVTPEDAAISLVNDINVADNGLSALYVLADGNIDVTVYSEDYINFSSQYSTPFTLKSLTCQKEVRYNTLGNYTFPSGTVNIPPPYTAIQSTSNLTDITGGRGRETDQELRIRVKNARNVGKATLSAINSALLDVTGVTNVIVLENDTETYDTLRGIEPKAFKCVVKGGDAQEIAQTIWDTKPAGIYADGDSVYVVKDSQNEDKEVRFSRVSQVYVHVKVEYSLYDEEISPEDMTSSIISEIVEYGNSLDIGEDVIQGRLASSLYRNISGLDEVIVSVGVTTSPNDPTPTLVTSPRIAISLLEESNFNENRVSVELIP